MRDIGIRQKSSFPTLFGTNIKKRSNDMTKQCLENMTNLLKIYSRKSLLKM